MKWKICLRNFLSTSSEINMFGIWKVHIFSEKKYVTHFFALIFIGIFFLDESNAKGGRAEIDDKQYAVLGLIAYNYTGRNIETYSVDESSGGDVRQSSPTSGGSGVVCCARISKDQKERILVNVKWQFDGCTYMVKFSAGKVWERRKFHYKEVQVYVDPPLSNEPAYLETHFYPDGSVKVKVTDEISLPELKLSEDRKDLSKFPKCENNDELE